MDNRGVKILFAVIWIFFAPDIHAQQDTMHVFFRLDDISLQANEQYKIDSLMYNDHINASQSILIIGYTDNLGSSGYNDSLSVRRAATVKQYLQQMGIPEKQITLCVGKGEVARATEVAGGYAADRRVDIAIVKGSVSRPKQQAKPQRTTPSTTKSITPEQEQHSSASAIPFNNETDIDIEDLEVGQLLVLNKIFFYTGRHIITKESLPELEKLYKLLADNRDLQIRIEGHVCCVPQMADALDYDTNEIALSTNRAKHIYYYLIKRGISADRLSYKGFGKSRPLSPAEETQEEQDKNKRVEIRILEL